MKYVIKLSLILLLASTIVFAGDSKRPAYWENAFWVVFDSQLGEVQLRSTENGYSFGIASVDARLANTDVKRVVKEVPGATERDVYGGVDFRNVYRVELNSSENLESLIDDFNRDPNIFLAERIPIYYPEEIVPYIPNDPYYSNEWHLEKIQASMAWGMWQGATPGSDTVVVAILDSGVDWDHPDLVNNLWQNLGEDADGDGHTIEFVGGQWVLDPGDLNGVDDDDWDNDPNSYVDDLIGWDFVGSTLGNTNPDNDPHSSPSPGFQGMLMHGTHVAGTVSPTANNGIGVVGPAFQARIMSIKLAYDDDTNNVPGVYSSPACYIYAARAGAHVLNCSFGGTGYSIVVQNAINLAHDTYNAIIVAAAGNDNVNLQNQHHYPSDYNNVISVAALNNNDTKASFSNYGPTVDISAPGVNIWSTVYKNVSGGYQGTWSGTSMAAPVVAGCFGLLKAFFPTKSISWLEQRLLDAADPIDQSNPNYQGWLGSGRVNIYNAIAQGILPNISYKTHALQIVGDLDGKLNPGETAYMRVTLQNAAGWNNAANVTAVLRSPTGDLHISDSLASYGNIGPGSIGINIADRFEFTVDSAAQVGQVPVEVLVKANQDSSVAYDITLSFMLDVSIDQVGWPQPCGENQSAPAVVDLNNDGQKEIIATSIDKKVYGWKADGTPLNGFPVETTGQITGSPAIGNLDSDSDLEIVVAGKGMHVYVLKADGSVELDYNVGAAVWGSPSLADLDSDGSLEIVFGDFNGTLHAIEADGTPLSGFPLALGATHRILSGVAIGDITGDAIPEICFGSFNGDVYAIDAASASPLAGFPVNIGARSEGAPVLADVDGNGPRTKEIVISAINGKIAWIDASGQINATATIGGAVKNSLSLADLNGDGSLEVLATSSDNALYAFAPDGTLLTGFPVQTGGTLTGSAAVADVDNDGQPEIAFSSGDANVYLVKSDGSNFVNFPVPFGAPVRSTPTFADVDGDGDIELCAGGSDKFVILDIPENGTTDGYWFTLQGNYRRTGDYGDVVTGISHYGEGNLPVNFNLMQNFPNPFNPSTTIRFALPQTEEVVLQVYNALGQRVRVLVRQRMEAGTHQIFWNGKDDAGQAVSSGIYYYQIKAGDFSQTRKMLFLK
ncbi:MAG: hypothetical protein Kow0037_15530 [Calditrichia bacterium]